MSARLVAMITCTSNSGRANAAEQISGAQQGGVQCVHAGVMVDGHSHLQITGWPLQGRCDGQNRCTGNRRQQWRIQAPAGHAAD